jgi:RNAse (barnase) inhibitor barstar
MMKLKKKLFIKERYKKKYKSTRQIRGMSYKIELTMYKTNQSKLWNLISNKLNISMKLEKKNGSRQKRQKKKAIEMNSILQGSA